MEIPLISLTAFMQTFTKYKILWPWLTASQWNRAVGKKVSNKKETVAEATLRVLLWSERVRGGASIQLLSKAHRCSWSGATGLWRSSSASRKTKPGLALYVTKNSKSKFRFLAFLFPLLISYASEASSHPLFLSYFEFILKIVNCILIQIFLPENSNFIELSTGLCGIMFVQVEWTELTTKLLGKQVPMVLCTTVWKNNRWDYNVNILILI